MREMTCRRRGELCSPRPQTSEDDHQPEIMTAREARRISGPFDLDDLELERSARRGDLDGLALLVADDGLADGRLVRQLVRARVGLRRADDVVLDRLLRGNVPQLDLRADGH